MNTTYLTTIPLYSTRNGRFAKDLPAQQIHRDVMSLFGDLEGKRADNGILFRLDEMANIKDAEGRLRTGRALLVRSAVEPTFPEGSLTPTMRREAVTVQEKAAPAAGTTVMFQVDVNTAQRHGKIESPVPVDQMGQWVTEKLEAALNILGITRMDSRTIDGPTGGRMRITAVAGVGQVKDSEALERLRTHGVGRAKNYGAGLITWTAL